MTGEAVLIAAQSGRALAGSARRAGYLPLVADLFCDLDTQAAALDCVRAGALPAGFRRTDLLAALDRLAAGRAPLGLVYGAGFEARPALLKAIARQYALLGNTAETVARTKDPFRFSALCREHDIPHPEVAEAGGEGWLAKRIGAAGGAHVTLLGRRTRPRPGRYAQRRADGRPVSALFLGDGRSSAVLGYSAQWADPLPRRPYRYGGAVRPAAVPQMQADAMAGAIARLAATLGLRGLNSADFLLRDDGFDLLEINPRPGATLDVHPDSEGQLFTQHIAACRGRLPASLAAPLPGRVLPAAGAAAACVVYAPHPIALPPGFAWPHWAADRQPPGSPVPRHAPLCTVRADAATPEAARALLAGRAAEILCMAAAR